MDMSLGFGAGPSVPQFDIVGEPETLNQRWTQWKSDFDMYKVAAEVKDPNVAQARMLLFGGPGLREVFNNFSEAEKVVGQDTDIYEVTSGLFDGYFKLKTCSPKARQNFLGTEPEPGEMVNSYIIRLKAMVKHCDYGDDSANQVRDRVIWHIKDMNLKSKLYRQDDLSLATLVRVIGEYHDKDALILIPVGLATGEPATVNRVGGLHVPK